MTIQYLVEKIEKPIDVIALMRGGFGYANAINSSLSAKGKESRLIEFYPLWQDPYREHKRIDFLSMRHKYRDAVARNRTDATFEEFCHNPLKRFIGRPNSNNLALLVDDLRCSGTTLASSVTELRKSVGYDDIFLCVEPRCSCPKSDPDFSGDGHLEELKREYFDESGYVYFRRVSDFNPLEDPVKRL